MKRAKAYAELKEVKHCEEDLKSCENSISGNDKMIYLKLAKIWIKLHSHEHQMKALSLLNK